MTRIRLATLALLALAAGGLLCGAGYYAGHRHTSRAEAADVGPFCSAVGEYLISDEAAGNYLYDHFNGILYTQIQPKDMAEWSRLAKEANAVAIPLPPTRSGNEAKKLYELVRDYQEQADKQVAAIRAANNAGDTSAGTARISLSRDIKAYRARVCP